MIKNPKESGKHPSNMNFDSRINGFRSKQCAMRCIQLKDRNSAKRHAYSMRRLSASISKSLEFQEKIREVLVFISEAEMSKQVLSCFNIYLFCSYSLFTFYFY